VSVGAGGHGVYSIGAVARMLDVPVATIRNWEERYAVVVPERSAGGQRLYSHEQVEQLRFLASQVARGLSAADAHRLLTEREAGGPAPPEEEQADRTRPLVLIAERDPIAAELAQSVLQGEGFEVELVFSASVAEALWLERRPQLAIVELMISGGQGTSLCGRLKQHDVGAVIASSALEAPDEALAAGADAFLQKPVDPAELVSTVRNLLAANAPGDA
jgi:DNA-binding transcriptional MerR regulator